MPPHSIGAFRTPEIEAVPLSVEAGWWRTFASARRQPPSARTTRCPRVAAVALTDGSGLFEVGFGTLLIDLGRCGIGHAQRQGYQAEPPQVMMCQSIVPPFRAKGC